MKRLVPAVLTAFVLGTLPGCGEATLVCAALGASLSAALGGPDEDILEWAKGGALLGLACEPPLAVIQPPFLRDTFLFVETEQGRARRAHREREGLEGVEIAGGVLITAGCLLLFQEDFTEVRFLTSVGLLGVGSYMFTALGRHEAPYTTREKVGRGMMIAGGITLVVGARGPGEPWPEAPSYIGWGWGGILLGIAVADPWGLGNLNSARTQLLIGPTGAALAYRF